MVHKDYVRCKRSTGACYKKNINHYKKLNSSYSISKILLIIATIIVITFFSLIWLIEFNKKKEDISVFPDQKAYRNDLPPKPKDRWKYIKELENSHIINAPIIKETSKSETMPLQIQITNEQSDLLKHIQADIYHVPVQLNEVSHNKQAIVQQKSDIQYYNQSTKYNNMLPINLSKKLQNHQIKRQEVEKIKTTDKEKMKYQHLMIRCLFKDNKQAELIRALLALEGFESRIIINHDSLNRVFIGPYSNYIKVYKALKNLNYFGHSSCIPISF